MTNLDKLFFHPTTLKNLEALIKNPPQSLIIHGPKGSGLSTALIFLAEKLQAKPLIFYPEKDDKIDEQGVIGVSLIRRLYTLTATKSKTKRLVVIENAETITEQAQNAFLKLLEEPKDNTFFIIITNNPDSLLPTIISRSSKLEIRPITSSQSQELLRKLGEIDPSKIQKILFLANHRPAEISRLATDSTYFYKQTELIQDSKTFLANPLYEKLLLVEKYRNNRPATLALLQACLLILKQTIPKQLDLKNLEIIELILSGQVAIKQNGNIRLWLTSIALSL